MHSILPYILFILSSFPPYYFSASAASTAAINSADSGATFDS